MKRQLYINPTVPLPVGSSTQPTRVSAMVLNVSHTIDSRDFEIPSTESRNAEKAEQRRQQDRGGFITEAQGSIVVAVSCKTAQKTRAL